jgi:hypothetical protein
MANTLETVAAGNVEHKHLVELMTGREVGKFFLKSSFSLAMYACALAI